ALLQVPGRRAGRDPRARPLQAGAAAPRLGRPELHARPDERRPQRRRASRRRSGDGRARRSARGAGPGAAVTFSPLRSRGGFALEHLARLVLAKPRAGHALAEPERATLARIAEVLLEGSPVELPMERIVDNFDRFLVLGRSRRAWRCRLLLTLVEYAPI